MTVWTDERVEKLRELCPKMSASEIGKILGVTRNAIIGKVHRLGLVKDIISAPAVKAPKKPRRPKAPAQEKQPEKLPDPIIVAQELLAGAPLFDIGPDQCHWVIGEPENFRCCADPVSHPGSAWCKAHRSIVYVPPRNRNLSKLAKFYR